MTATYSSESSPATRLPSDPAELVSLGTRVLGSVDHGDLVWGHASVRDPGGQGAWMKANAWSFSEVTPDRVLLVDPDGEVLAGEGGRHTEYPIHTEIYASRPDVGAVVHAHPQHSVAFSATGQPLRAVGHHASMFVPPQIPRFTETSDLIRSRRLGKAVAESLQDHKALFLVNHGIVAVGPDLPTAVVTAVLLEMACRQQLLTHAFGGWPTWTSDADSASKRDSTIYVPAHLRQVWDLLVRNLERGAGGVVPSAVTDFMS
jgi:L-ribulose-5-phosphate 4-epimerase